MRIGYGLIAGSLVVAWAVGSASSQTPTTNTTVSPQTVAPPAPPVVSGIRVRPLEGGRLSTSVTTVKTLTEGECTGLGGTVHDIVAKKCDSGRVCINVASDGTIRALCITQT